jgi:hypothetical protein
MESVASRLGEGRVIHSNFFEADGNLKADSVDLMVPSPPFMNNQEFHMASNL